MKPGEFIEVYVNVIARGRRAARPEGPVQEGPAPGEIKGFTGIDDPYEAPEKPEIVIDTETTDARGGGASRSSAYLEKSGYLVAVTSLHAMMSQFVDLHCHSTASDGTLAAGGRRAPGEATSASSASR